VIKKWEDEIAEKKEEVEKENNQKKENDNENEEIAIEGREDKVSKSIGKGEKEVDIEEGGEAGRKVEAEAEVEERGFGTYWPFLCSQRECDRASDYLSAINNSHIITQLISNLKILQLAEERGLQISDRDLIAEIGNVEIPRIGKHEDDLYYSDDYDDYDDDYDDDRYYSDEYSDDDELGEDGDHGNKHSNSGGNRNGDRGSDRGSVRGSDRGSDRGSGPVNESAEAVKNDFVQGDQVDLKEHERDKEDNGKGDKGKGDKGKGDKGEVQKGNEEKEKKETELKEIEAENSYSDDDEDEDEDDYEHEYDDRDSDRRRQTNQLRSKKRKSRRRTANNKKRRMKKKTKCAEADNKEGRESKKEVVDETREEVEGEGMVRTRVTFNIDSRHQVQDPLLAHSQSQPHSQPQIIPSEEHDIKIIDDCDEHNGIKQSTAILSSCPTIKSQHTALVESKSEDLNGHTSSAARTYIRDIVSTDEKKKSIRVHEYYKLWRIYDLDVVY
jgi:hypothetical protein